MRITLGLSLDGQRAIRPSNRLGDIDVGPLGLLGLLETSLGLAAPVSPTAERVIQYRDCLARRLTDQRFYARSFQTDELGTAALMLEWRDTWRLAGWAGTFTTEAPTRLRDMAEVEDEASQLLSPGIGDRLALVLTALDTKKTGIKEIVLFDPLDAFPLMWQRVLAKLPLKPASLPMPQAPGMLGDLQRALMTRMAGESVTPLTWRDDGTLEIVQSETVAFAARWLARQMAEMQDALIVCGGEGERLDGALAASDNARTGLRDASVFRPALQVLPLALDLLWAPLNFQALVQFLTHPVCPIPGFARRRLAEKIARAPGIGGADWTTALDEIDAYYRKESGERATAVREAITLWVEPIRHDITEGAPVSALLARAIALTDFFRNRLIDDDPSRRSAFSAAFGQCSAAADALRALSMQRVDTLSPAQVKKLVTQATARGSENPMRVAEVGAHRAISDPAAAFEDADHVIWWQMQHPHLPAPYPWSRSERTALADAGVQLPSIESELQRIATNWCRPVTAARQKLTLVLPPPSVDVHPVWQMIRALLPDAPVRGLETILDQGGDGAHALAETPLPTRRRWWQLPADVTLPPREKESFSSLELLLFTPFHWLLKYPARLRPSNLVELSNEFLLRGNLAHNLIEQYYHTPGALDFSDMDFNRWFEKEFPQLITEQGATFLMPGRSADLAGFRHRLHHAMSELRRHLALAKIHTVTAEQAVEGHFTGGTLAGYADLVLERDSSSGADRAIIDMKWSGFKKYSQKLAKNRHLQLALYAELLRQKTGAWPALAYFILDEARLLASDNQIFAQARQVKPETDETAAHLWQRFLTSYAWRREQLEAGHIEVALEGILEDEDSAPPETAIAPEYLSESYNDYLCLAGWENAR